jgi:phenylacetate-CoA ligase
VYRNELTRRQVERITADQQRLIKQWCARRFDISDGYGTRLRSVVESALQLPFYAKLYRGIVGPGADSPALGDSDGYQDLLRRLPTISKADAHRVGGDVLALRRASLLNYFETSGTTGLPTPAPKSLDEIVINTVNFGESWAEFLTPHDRALILINTPQGPAAFQFEKVFNYLGVMTFRTWVDTVRNDYGRVLEILERCQPNIWAGPASQLINLYEHAHQSGARPPRFQKVLLTGEPVGPALRRRIIQLTGGLVFDASFGSSETGTTAVAWAGRTLRLQTQSYIFELRTEDGIELVSPAMSGSGELVVTSLQNLNRPLLRYRTGDLVTITAQDDGAQILTPNGRVRDLVHLGKLHFTQNQLEELIWPEDSPSGVFNYMIAYDDSRIDVIVTADDGPATREILGRLTSMLPGSTAHVVPQLPAVSSLGSALGWKAARIVDLRDTSRGTFSEMIADGIRDSRRFVQDLRVDTGTRTR